MICNDYADYCFNLQIFALILPTHVLLLCFLIKIGMCFTLEIKRFKILDISICREIKISTKILNK